MNVKPYHASEAARRAAARDEADTHALVARTRRGGLVKLEEFPSYDEALTAWAAATECLAGYDKLVAEYAVRSVDDPAVKKLAPYTDGKPGDYYRSNYVHAKLREAHRKEVGATALWAIKNTSAGASIDGVIKAATDSLSKRGLKVARWEVQEAVKSRVLIGRCHDRHAWWIRKSEGPLFNHTCPRCGGSLAATSLALQATFRRLDVEAEKQRLRDTIEECDVGPHSPQTDDEFDRMLWAGRQLDRLEGRR